ncbi:hypothetical protein OE88DRAFT_1482376 [Heliocybe sulcata]|uniref:F-box domain-containing protein n=1 Tax=Heliocybe sulcata TaxID=5364 RepID=A0A5C3NEB0_9AGAM|nr:hypothetical protein OE88DRAFT_1482376 [Heliocybe sulcata]
MTALCPFDLPFDIQEIILHELHTPDLGRLSSTCKGIRGATDREEDIELQTICIRWTLSPNAPTGEVVTETQRLSPEAYETLAEVLEHALNLQEFEAVDADLLFAGNSRIPKALIDLCPRLSSIKIMLFDTPLCIETLQQMRYLQEVNLYLCTRLSSAVTQAFQAAPTVLKLSSPFSSQLSNDLYMPSVVDLQLLGPTLPAGRLARSFPNVRRLTLHQGFGTNSTEVLHLQDHMPCWHNLDFLRGDAGSLRNGNVVCPTACLEVVRHPRPFLPGHITTIRDDKLLHPIINATSPMSLSFTTNIRPTGEFLRDLVSSTPRLRFLHMVLEPEEWKSSLGRASADILNMLTSMPDALHSLPAVYLSIHIGIVVALFQIHNKRFRDALALRFAQALPSVRFLELGLRAVDNEEYPSHRWWYKLDDASGGLRRAVPLLDGRAWRAYWSKQVLITRL